MKYLLDTCTVSDFVKGQPGVLARIKTTLPNLIAVSAVSLMEIEFGLQLNSERARNLAPVMDAFLSRAAGALHAALQKQEPPIGAYDVLIAGCGLAHGLVVVTSNVGEFQRISGLQVEDWR
jgi:tRNA(fMet)-specific endonuclease VapC